MKKIFQFIIFYLIIIIIFLNLSGVAFNQESNAIRKKLTVIDLITKEESNSIIVDMVIPVIEGMQDKQVEEKINRMLQNDAYNFREGLQADSEIFATNAEKEGWKYNKYIASSYYIVHFHSKNILSVSVFYYQYTLGAHGHTLQKAYNINLKNGEIITLPNLLKDMENNKKLINQEIKRQIQLHPYIYFNGGEAFKSINDDQPFYIIEDGIVIFFGLYEISPYVYGIRYFKIPFSLIEMHVSIFE